MSILISLFLMILHNVGTTNNLIYLAIAMKARSTFSPVLALVSMNATLYSCKINYFTCIFSTLSANTHDIQEIKYEESGMFFLSYLSSLTTHAICLLTFNFLMKEFSLFYCNNLHKSLMNEGALP